jgi:HEAT repeat protein
VTGKRPATETDVRELLLAGMTDPDTFVREHAVGMIASILQLSSMPGVPPEFQWGIARRPVAQALWPELNAAADDSEARVRSEAIRGIAVVFAHGNPIFRSASELSARLVAKLDTDPLPGIRSLAVSALGSAHRSYDPAIRDLALRVVLKALDDADPFIVQAAAHGAAEFTPPQALPLLAKQLQHPSHVARMAVGQVIAAYRERARAYVPALEAALAVETDDITRKTILGTLSIIR